MKRLSDQALVLSAIGEVRSELEAAKDAPCMVRDDILVRLAALYALLDVNRLVVAVVVADSRSDVAGERKVA